MAVPVIAMAGHLTRNRGLQKIQARVRYVFLCSPYVHWTICTCGLCCSTRINTALNRKDIMLRKFICKVTHYDLGEESVMREHVIYMPEQEYDKSGSRWRNHNWVEKKLEEKIGKKYDDGSYSSKWYINRIYQERL